MSRYSDAVDIQGGACNPIAILNTMQRAVEEIRLECGGSPPTELVLQDPSLRLMAHQLCFLFNAHDAFDQIKADYLPMLELCEKRSLP